MKIIFDRLSHSYPIVWVRSNFGKNRALALEELADLREQRADRSFENGHERRAIRWYRKAGQALNSNSHARSRAIEIILDNLTLNFDTIVAVAIGNGNDPNLAVKEFVVQLIAHRAKTIEIDAIIHTSEKEKDLAKIDYETAAILFFKIKKFFDAKRCYGKAIGLAEELTMPQERERLIELFKRCTDEIIKLPLVYE